MIVLQAPIPAEGKPQHPPTQACKYGSGARALAGRLAGGAEGAAPGGGALGVGRGERRCIDARDGMR